MKITDDSAKAARRFLLKADPQMSAIVKTVGPCKLKLQRNRFQTLVFSILSQQISTAAARTIKMRLLDQLKPGRLTPRRLVEFQVGELREAGISRQKASYILDLASKVHSGEVNFTRVGRLEDEEAIAELTKIKGIGRWTAQMFLMFTLGRPDVFPVDDLGIQNAIQRAYPKPRGGWTREKYERVAKRWSPHTTIACWYLWRSLE